MKRSSARAPASREWLVLLLLAMLALAARLVFLSAWAGTPLFHVPQGDEKNFHETAVALLQGGQLDSFLYQPLYTYFLFLLYWLLGPSVALARTVQLFLGVGTTLLFYGLGRELVRGDDMARARWSGRLSALFVAAYGPQVFFEAQLLAPALVVPLLAGGCWALLAARNRRRPLLLLPAGICCGLALMGRPNLLPVLPAAVIWWLWGRMPLRQRLAGLGLALAGLLLGVLPSWSHNIARGQWWVPVSSSGGHSFFIGNNPDATGAFHVPRGWPIDDSSHAAYRRSLQAIAEKRQGRRLTAAQVSSFWYRQGLAFWREHPGQALSLAGWKAMLLLNDTEKPIHHPYSFACHLVPPLRYYLRFGLLFPFFLLGLWPAAGRWQGRRLLAASTLMYAAGLVAFYVADRYRIVLLPFLAPLAAVGVVELFLLARGRTLRRALGRVLVLLLGFGLTQVPVTSESQERKDISDGYNLLGVSAAAQGDMLAARRFFEQAVRWAGPDHGILARANLGLFYERLGDRDRARNLYLEAARISPRARLARERLARMAELAGDWQQAIDWWQQVARLEANPEKTRAHIERLRARLRKGAGRAGTPAGDRRPAPPGSGEESD
ncbi:MAG: hypothetical protein DRI34_01165 [Deltaproteobacteria bacterium]|nr:MAG: hypothetical protein DRI34_01165 [Deltaproteobacteria bacterium]